MKKLMKFPQFLTNNSQTISYHICYQVTNHDLLQKDVSTHIITLNSTAYVTEDQIRLIQGSLATLNYIDNTHFGQNNFPILIDHCHKDE